MQSKEAVQIDRSFRPFPARCLDCDLRAGPGIVTIPKGWNHGDPIGGSALKDPSGLLKGEGKFVRHIKVRTRSDIDEKAFGTLLRQAAR